MENNIKELRLSVSKTKTYLDCKAKYNFSYNLHLPKREWGHLTFGKFCHKVLEDYHQIYLDGSKLPFNIVMAQAFKNAKEEFKKETNKEMIKECWEIINQYLKIVSKEKKPANVIACEKKFNVVVGPSKLIESGEVFNVSLIGMIDRVQIDDDNVLRVIDYKTSKSKKYLAKDFFQLATYAWIMLLEDPSIKKVRGSYVLLRHNFEYITTEFKRDEILKIQDKYLDYASRIINEQMYDPNPTPLCNWCDFQENCIIGKQKMAPEKIYGEVTW